MKQRLVTLLMLALLTTMVVAESTSTKSTKKRDTKVDATSAAKAADKTKAERRAERKKAEARKAEKAKADAKTAKPSPKKTTTSKPAVKKPYKPKPKPKAKPAPKPPKPGPLSPADPYRISGPLRANNAIDTILLAEFKTKGIKPAALCSNAVFCRRVFIDLMGTMPHPNEARAFLASKDPKKRAKLIASLLNRKEFNSYWTLKWCDHLRVKSEFPINLWPNAVAAYHQWVFQAIKTNMPYDQFARALLTSSGSNFRVPAVNFYRAMQSRTPDGIAQAVATTFLGTTLEAWPEAKQKQLAAMFANVKYKSTDEWKEQIIYNDSASSPLRQLTMPDGRRVALTAFDDPRQLFAQWLLAGKNPGVARAAVNRLWVWMFGHGLVDDKTPTASGRPKLTPKVLAYLSEEFIRSKYNQRHILQLIANSAIYQQSAIPVGPAAKAKAAFASYPLRRLDAEVLIDAIDFVTVSHEKYMSIIPEPFTFIPIRNRTIGLADGSITNPFLEMFGRPARDTGLLTERKNTPSVFQQLHMLNSTDIQGKLIKSSRVISIMKNYKLSVPQRTSELYLLILSRYPTPAEAKIAIGYLTKRRFGKSRSGETAFWDLAWALLNTPEFLYRH